MKWLLMAFCVSSVACSTVKQNDPNIPIGNFYQVPGDANVYRGAQPDHAGMVWLANHGIKTIINLNDDKNSMEQEAADARALGLTEISIPINSFATPNDDDIKEIESTINIGVPTFVHCQHGQDRTGLIIGLRRVHFYNWTAKDAHDEMLQYGFHTILIPLEDYFWDHSKSVPEFHH